MSSASSRETAVNGLARELDLQAKYQVEFCHLELKRVRRALDGKQVKRRTELERKLAECPDKVERALEQLLQEDAATLDAEWRELDALAQYYSDGRQFSRKPAAKDTRLEILVEIGRCKERITQEIEARAARRGDQHAP